MRKVISAGGIFIRNKNGIDEILLLKRPSGELGLLKGHQKRGETIEETVIREVKEETGIKNVIIIKKIGELTRKGRERTGEKVIKTIHLFLVETDNFSSSNPEEKYDWFEFDYGASHLRNIEEAEFLRVNKDAIFN